MEPGMATVCNVWLWRQNWLWLNVNGHVGGGLVPTPRQYPHSAQYKADAAIAPLRLRVIFMLWLKRLSD